MPTDPSKNAACAQGMQKKDLHSAYSTGARSQDQPVVFANLLFQIRWPTGTYKRLGLSLPSNSPGLDLFWLCCRTRHRRYSQQMSHVLNVPYHFAMSYHVAYATSLRHLTRVEFLQWQRTGSLPLWGRDRFSRKGSVEKPGEGAHRSDPIRRLDGVPFGDPPETNMQGFLLFGIHKPLLGERLFEVWDSGG